MISRKISAIRELAEALPKDELQKRATLPIFQELQGTVQTVHEAVKEQVQETVQEIIGGEWIKMPFLHDEIQDIRAKWNLANFNPDAPNYIRNGLTGDGMKMFSFDSNEDVVPQVPVGPGLDKTGGQIKFDRLDLKLNHPEQYARFSKLYEHFRDCDFDSDKDFLPDAYTFKPYVKRPVDNVIIRNHMPYTYMPLLLCSLSDEAVNAHIVEVPRKTAEDQMPDWDMFVGEVYKLPLTKTGMFTWKSSDKTVAAVDEKGMLCAKKPGDAVLTITTPTGNKSGINIHVTSV